MSDTLHVTYTTIRGATAMVELLKADLDAIRVLAGKQRASAADIRGIDFSGVFADVTGGLSGSDVAARCAAAAGKITAALGEVAVRIEKLSDTNLQAANTIGLADDTYAQNIKNTLNFAP